MTELLLKRVGCLDLTAGFSLGLSLLLSKIGLTDYLPLFKPTMQNQKQKDVSLQKTFLTYAVKGNRKYYF